MPKSPRPPSSDEASLMESISRKPEILETINQAFASGRKKQKEIYDELAQNFNCEADLLRKVYIKLRQTKEVKKSKHHLGETRPKSAQSVSSESSRRSARLLIKEGSTASSIVGESVDTSCASSLCSVSPPTKECILTEDKPTRKTRSSVRNLCPISELEPVVVDNVTTTVLPPDSTSTTTTAASSTTTTASTTTTSSVVPTAAANNTAATAAQQDKKRHHQQPLKQQQAEEHDAGDEDEDTQSEATIVTVDEQATTNCNTSGSTTSKYLQESNFSEPSKPTLCRMGRFSEPTQIPKLTQTTPSLTSGGGGGGSSRKSLSNKSFSKSTNSGSGSRENRGLLNPAEEPTRVFFESMGLTVMNFPQHLQASVKVQVSNIVHDLEYELTSPHTTAEQKASIVVS